MTKRKELIPSVSDYAHHNEDAQAIWYEENKYDMLYGDEEVDRDDDNYDFEDE
tara:strand:+ start:661 stop:819 length:159 start_codon:yes stop_codon:yes gene_type:complete